MIPAHFTPFLTRPLLQIIREGIQAETHFRSIGWTPACPSFVPQCDHYYCFNGHPPITRDNRGEETQRWEGKRLTFPPAQGRHRDK
ncbi:hypothetical protein E2C01_054458 [Portunus trituberculatus]|uniref:Uncharacterized protein n=1 Tax=Portunus trituberculatus TaxID=210409 RepID=A0A5B7GV27_PORTR|nr:hypothetical protein [Portunus trituberculatus]